MTDPGGFEPESVRVAQRLREDIVDGVREPGSRLVERDVSAQLGVSRLPVRDALKTLAAEGLVTPRPRTWAVVRVFTAEDIAELREVRGALEPLAFRLAAERRSSAGLAELQAVVAEQLAAAKAGDARRARRAAADFHEAVTELSGNTLLAELERPVRSRMRWLLARHEDLEGVAHEHEELCAAVADGDVARVGSLVAEHLLRDRESAGVRVAD